MTNLGLYAPGYSRLGTEDKQALHDFLFLWPLFEKKIFNMNCCIRKIQEIVAYWDSIERLKDNYFWLRELDYFKNRYAGGDHADRFDSLNFRLNDKKELVKNVIFEDDQDSKNQLIALLIIIYRLRNNLFHGEKWAYEMIDQKENFQNAISIMCKILDLHLPPLAQN